MNTFFTGAGKFVPLLLLINVLLPFPKFVYGQESGAGEVYSDEVYSDDEYLFENETGIAIVGTRQTSQQRAVIDREEIERRSETDLAGLLQGALNLNITRYGAYGNQAGINLRGFDSKRVAFLVDGLPVNTSTDGKFDINQIDLNSIERIEVISGGSDSRYNVSGALGGVINIITVKKQNPGLRLDASVSNTSTMPGEYMDRNAEKQNPHWEDFFDAQNFSISTAYGSDAFSFAAHTFANRAANHFIFRDYIDIVRRKDNNEIWDTGANVSVVWGLNDPGKLIATLNFYYGDKNIPGSGFSSIAGRQKDITGSHSLMLDMPRAFHDELGTEASLVYNFSDRTYGSPGVEESRHDQHSVMAINRWNWRPGRNLSLCSGFDYNFILLDSTEMGRRNRHNGGIYLTAEYQLRESFLVIPSIKAVITSGGQGRVTPVPKLGFALDIGDSLTLKNNYFRSFKFPDFEELYWSGGGSFGNPDLKPEDGWGADMGAALRLRELFSFDTVFFTQWTKDSIHWYSKNSGVWRPENVGEAIFFGLDNKLSFEIPVSLGSIKELTLSLSYQYLLSYLLSYGYDFYSDKRIPYMPAHTIGASLDLPWKTGSLLISAHYESLRYADISNITNLEPHFLLNASLNQKIGKLFTAFAALKNILNESYESFYDYPMPGITLILGVRTQFEVN